MNFCIQSRPTRFALERNVLAECRKGTEYSACTATEKENTRKNLISVSMGRNEQPISVIRANCSYFICSTRRRNPKFYVFLPDKDSYTRSRASFQVVCSPKT